MKQPGLQSYIRLDDKIATPKYLQWANSIRDAIGSGILNYDTALPSINEASFYFNLSRQTIEKGYSHLKKIGLVESSPRLGYYINHSQYEPEKKILLLFNNLSNYKKIIYDALIAGLGTSYFVDFHVYNNDGSTLKKILERAGGSYTHYVIIPHFESGSQTAFETIDLLPKKKLILLDKYLDFDCSDYSAVYENFEKDIYSALCVAQDRLRKYKKMKMIIPAGGYYPNEIRSGFKQFCEENKFHYSIDDKVNKDGIETGQVYIIIRDEDLVELVKTVNQLNLEIGKDIGVISYNETPMKKLIQNGVTTISTDFVEMGAAVAQLIRQKCINRIEIPFRIEFRQSL